jgi:hypothetical protein
MLNQGIGDEKMYMGEARSVRKALFEKPEGRSQLGRPRRR